MWSFFRKNGAESDEYARVIDGFPQWSTGAPMPQVFSGDGRTFLIYLINELDPDWDGSYITMKSNTLEVNYPLALVEFDSHTFKFGMFNDEVSSGYHLYKKGIVAYSAHIIENSRWINELKNIHRVHSYFNEERWVSKKHFFLFFKDEMFEIIAKKYSVETFNTTFLELSQEIVRRINALNEKLED